MLVAGLTNRTRHRFPASGHTLLIRGLLLSCHVPSTQAQGEDLLFVPSAASQRKLGAAALGRGSKGEGLVPTSMDQFWPVAPKRSAEDTPRPEPYRLAGVLASFQYLDRSAASQETKRSSYARTRPAGCLSRGGRGRAPPCELLGGPRHRSRDLQVPGHMPAAQRLAPGPALPLEP
jgi:hypothetical protein